MPFTTLKPNGIDLSQTFAFTGTVTGAGGGKLLQTQTALFTSQTAHNSETYSATGYTDQITPSATNSKIFVTFNFRHHNYQSGDISEDILSGWMGSKIQQTAENCHTHIKNYRFDLASAEIYELVWSHFCDWYIEFNKAAIQKSDDHEQTNRLIGNLITNFYSILELLHPFMPFITEELSSKLANLANTEKSGFLVESGFAHARTTDNNTEKYMDEIINIISALRVIRFYNLYF